MVTLKDIAKEAGVSVTTVSQVLNGREREGRIGSLKAEAVRRAAASLDYRPMAAARAVRKSKACQVGFLVMNRSDEHRIDYLPVYEMILGLANRLEREGLLMVVFRQDELLDESGSRLLKERVVDGLVVSGAITAQCVEIARKGFEHVVWLDTVAWEDFSSIRRDELRSGRLAAKSLLDSGWERLVWFGSFLPGDHYSICDRFEGARREAEGRGAEFLDAKSGRLTFKEGDLDALGRLLDGRTGLVAFNPTEARMLAHAVAGRFRKLPGWDYGLACCDESQDIIETWPDLSRVANDRYAAGGMAGEMIVQAMSGRPSPSITISGRWIEGATSKRILAS